MKTFLYPSVPSVQPGERPLEQRGVQDRALFEATLKQETERSQAEGLRFSGHAVDRLRSRSIPMDQGLTTKLLAATERAREKGIEDALILSKSTAFIVNVPNKTVITACDLQSLKDQVFTKIDGAVLIS
jgi:flagellar operon protein